MTDQSNKEQEQPSMSPVILGGVIGTGVGLLASPKTGKRLAGKLKKSDMLNKMGTEISHTVQEIIYDQAKHMIRQNLSNSLINYQNKLFNTKIENKSQKDDPSSNKDVHQEEMEEKYKELKEENKALNDSLESIEEKLNKLVLIMDK